MQSAETLREEEAPLLAKVRSRQTCFGNSWADVMSMAARLQAAFGPDGRAADVDPDAPIETLWEAAEPRAVERVSGG